MEKYRVYIHINGSDTFIHMYEFYILKCVIEALGWDYIQKGMLYRAYDDYTKYHVHSDILRMMLILVMVCDNGYEEQLYVEDLNIEDPKPYYIAINDLWKDKLNKYLADIATGKRKPAENEHFYPQYF